MEALAALSIVANVFQVIDFSMNVLSTANELRKAGTTKDQSDISMVVDDLKTLNSKLKHSSQAIASPNNLSQDQLDLERLVDRASAISEDLIRLLDHHKVPPGSSRLTSLAKAIRSSWDEKKVIEMTNQLERIRDELSFRVLVSIRTDLDVVGLRNDDRFDRLDDATKKILEAILDNRVILKAELQVNSEELRSRLQTCVRDALDDFNDKAVERHQEIMYTVKSALQRAPGVMNANEVHSWIESSLKFGQIDDRYDDISPAHQRTFQWIFQDSGNCSFAKWISSAQSQGIYWICGKAGSGKSTLMKLIDDDKRLADGLKLWAGDVPLVTASFFFWKNGTEIQRSYRGLLRSLLFQVVRGNSQLCAILFPRMYEGRPDWTEFPSLHDLKRAFKILTTQDHIPLKMAFLIDGLDEYESSDMGMDMLALMFTEAAKSSNVKLILSGRPIRVLEKSFEPYDSLRLEHHTGKDISDYVNQQIKEHPDLAVIARNQPDLADELVAEVVESAAGVFLWVVLVTRSLIEGFQNRDTIQILRERLREIPTDIYKLFSHMLRQVPLRYRTRSAQIFQLHRTITDRNFLIKDEFQFLPAFALSFAFLQPENDITTIGKAMSKEEARQRIQDIDIQLKTHCAGLLEIRKMDFTPAQQLLGYTYELDVSINYIHRTAADFLTESDIWSRIVADSEDFDVLIQLLKSWVLQLTRISIYASNPLQIFQYSQLFREFVCLAKYADKLSTGDVHEILKKLDSVFCEVLKAWLKGNHWANVTEKDYNLHFEWHENFLSFLVRVGSKRCVEKEIETYGSSIINKKGRPLLDYACRPEPAYPEHIEAINPDIVALLLANGADPNQKFNEWTPFQSCLYSLHKMRLSEENGFKMIQMLLSHGADADAFISYKVKIGKFKYRQHRLSALGVLESEKVVAMIEAGRESEYKELIRMLKSRKGKNRHWVSIYHEEFELENGRRGDARIWHDIDGEFVPKTTGLVARNKDGTAIENDDGTVKIEGGGTVQKLVLHLDRLKRSASRRLSRQ